MFIRRPILILTCAQYNEFFSLRKSERMGEEEYILGSDKMESVFGTN